MVEGSGRRLTKLVRQRVTDFVNRKGAVAVSRARAGGRWLRKLSCGDGQNFLTG
jgi:hypothetical protein